MINSIKKISNLFKKNTPSDTKLDFNEFTNDRDLFNSTHQCLSCHTHIEYGTLKSNLFVCPKCDYHFRVSAQERMSMIFDNGVYENISLAPSYHNYIEFPDYDIKLQSAQQKSGEDEAVSIALGKVLDRDLVVACMSFNFLGGSMGTLVGERIIQALFSSIKKHCPCVIVTASGGARMYEGLYSLMQMARVSHVIGLFRQQRLPLFILLTDPTTGGVTASFAMLGDYMFAEPNALIGFAGPRVIEGTIKQKLPENFQRAEFQLEKGFVDAIVARKNFRKVLVYFMYVHENN